jgi:hypothetical protein
MYLEGHVVRGTYALGVRYITLCSLFFAAVGVEGIEPDAQLDRQELSAWSGPEMDSMSWPDPSGAGHHGLRSSF